MKFDSFHQTFGTIALHYQGAASFFYMEEPAHFRGKELMIFILCRAVIARGVKWS